MIGNQTQVCICSTPEDKRASRKIQWPNMQWNKKEAFSTSRESQECLDRRVALCTLESKNYA
jgi:hypothetical protein